MIELTKRQARQFLLMKHGLIGEYKFEGKQGVLDFISQAGCIQFDPIDACGKNSELVLQSRVKGFRKDTLDELLYKDRVLIDYFDKNLSIIPINDWPYFTRYRKAYHRQDGRYEYMLPAMQKVKEYISKHGVVCSSDLDFGNAEVYYRNFNWSESTKLSRAVLEYMYFIGDLVIHHKKGTRKFYDLAEKHIPAELLNAPEPIPNELDYQKWRVHRRIGAIGLLWNKASDAWLNIWGLRSAERGVIFQQLLDEKKILEISVAGIKDKLYCLAEDHDILEAVLQNLVLKPRCELIAPLDNLIWDRKLIKELFDFDYKWEIYTPEAQRKYGYYVLPIIYDDNFIGRIETVCDRENKLLIVKNFWLEEGVKPTKTITRMVDGCVRRLAALNHLQTQRA